LVDNPVTATEGMTTGAAAPVLTARGLVLARDYKPIARLRDIEVSAGESIALVGRSGCGKTTALMAMAAIRAPASGTVTIGGIDPWTLPSSVCDQFRCYYVGLVFQSFHLIDALSVAANIQLPARCASRLIDRRIATRAGDRRFDEDERLHTLLDKLGLTGVATHRADRISHGQAQRVAVARALFNKPAVILADEPTSALDDANAAALLDLLKQSAITEGAALVIGTHDRRVLQTVDKVMEVEQL
jgi:putative ABC transport system ATP-binding protein